MNRKRVMSIAILSLAVAATQVDAWWFSAANDNEQKQTSPQPAYPSKAPELTRALATQKQQQEKIMAIASFDMLGVKGRFKFSQSSMEAPTRVEYDLTGLQGNNQLYHVHLFTVSHNMDQKMNVTQTCSHTGGHLNPSKVPPSGGLAPQAAPLDRYEMGDLRGKHGPLKKVDGPEDRYVGSFTDSNLPILTQEGIAGRSIVIHKNNGDRWVCADIVQVKVA